MAPRIAVLGPKCRIMENGGEGDGPDGPPP